METETIRYHVRCTLCVGENIGQVAAALAAPHGSVVSTTTNYTGDGHDLAIVDVPREQLDWYEQSWENDERVVTF